jgi:hypothetical protein
MKILKLETESQCLNQNFFSVLSPEFKDLRMPNGTNVLAVLVVLGHLLYIPIYTTCLTGPSQSMGLGLYPLLLNYQ